MVVVLSQQRVHQLRSKELKELLQLGDDEIVTAVDLRKDPDDISILITTRSVNKSEPLQSPSITGGYSKRS